MEQEDTKCAEHFPPQAKKPYCVIARASDELAKARVAVYIVVCEKPEAEISVELAKRFYKTALSAYVKDSQITFYSDILKDVCDARPERTRLLRDCKKGRYDIIVTRSRERFARFRYEADQIAESLKYLDPPVRVRFENDTADQPWSHQLSVKPEIPMDEQSEGYPTKVAVYCRVSTEPASNMDTGRGCSYKWRYRPDCRVPK